MLKKCQEIQPSLNFRGVHTLIDIASCADNTPYSVGKNPCDLETKLRKASFKLYKGL